MRQSSLNFPIRYSKAFYLSHYKEHRMRADDTPASQLPFSIQNILRDDFPAASRPSYRPSSGRVSPGPTRNRIYLPSRGYGGYFMNCFPYVPYSMYYTGVVPLLPQQNVGILRPQTLNPNVSQDDETADESESISDEGSENSEEQRNPQSENDNQQARPEDQMCRETEPSTSNTVTKTSHQNRRSRSQFTDQQLHYLETYFSHNKYLSRDERTVLAKALDMTELQIRNWFQNKRYQRKHLHDTTTDTTAAAERTDAGKDTSNDNKEKLEHTDQSKRDGRKT